MNDSPEKISASALHARRSAATVLLLVAGFALFGKYLPFAWRDGALLLLGCGFIVWGAVGRVAALLIPGGILVGIGTGALLRPEHGNAVFLLAMAGGFALISVLTYVFFQKWVRWPVYPAGGLAFAGAIQLAGSGLRQWLRDFAPFWPYALIAIALYLLFTKPRAKS
ncbi:MAG: hypothetical protein WCR49_03425 [Opitutae bacterium]